MHERRGNRAVEPRDGAVFHPLPPCAAEQRLVDRLPRFGPDGADGFLEHRLFRGPRHGQARKGPKRRRILQMERQFLVTQLAILLEKPATQRRFRRQTMPADIFHPAPAQISHHQIEQLAMAIKPLRHRFQLPAGLVIGETIE